MSKREAARRAGFSEAVWRHLESGERQVGQGVVMPINPRDETLIAAATAVGLDPAEVFRAAGRPYYAEAEVEAEVPAEPRTTERRLEDLERRVSRVEEQLASGSGGVVVPDLSDPAQQEVWDFEHHSLEEKLLLIAELQRQDREDEDQDEPKREAS